MYYYVLPLLTVICLEDGVSILLVHSRFLVSLASGLCFVYSFSYSDPLVGRSAPHSF